MPLGGFPRVLIDIIVDVDKQYVDINDLDINTAGVYEIFFCVKNPLTVGCAYFLFVEGDYTLANYYNQWIWAHGTTLEYRRANTPEIMYSTAGQASSTHIVIWRDPLGYFRYRSDIVRNIGADVQLVSRSGCSITTKTNITRIRLYAGVAGGIGAGSRIIVKGM